MSILLDKLEECIIRNHNASPDPAHSDIAWKLESLMYSLKHDCRVTFLHSNKYALISRRRKMNRYSVAIILTIADIKNVNEKTVSELNEFLLSLRS